MDADSAVKALAGVLGSGGLVTGLLGYLAYRTEVARGRKPDPQNSVVPAIGGMLAENATLRQLLVHAAGMESSLKVLAEFVNDKTEEERLADMIRKLRPDLLPDDPAHNRRP